MKKTILAMACAAAILPSLAQATSFEDIATLDFSVSASGSSTFQLSWADLISTKTSNKGVVSFDEDNGKYSLMLTRSDNSVVFKLNDFLDSSSASTGTYTYTSPSLMAGSYTLTFGGKWNGNNGNNSSTFAVPSVSITAVPEPETYAMLLAGLGLIGAIVRRKNV